MKLEDLVKWKKYKINKPKVLDTGEGICWLEDDMDFLDGKIVKYYEDFFDSELGLITNKGLDKNDYNLEYYLDPSWLTKVEDSKDTTPINYTKCDKEEATHLYCIKTEKMCKEEGGDTFATLGEVYPLQLDFCDKREICFKSQVTDYHFFDESEVGEYFLYVKLYVKPITIKDTVKEEQNDSDFLIDTLSTFDDVEVEEPEQFTASNEKDFITRFAEASRNLESERAKGLEKEWSDKHYSFIYKHPVTRGDSDVGFVEIKVDPYFVNKLWGLNSKDDTGCLFHNLKTIARFTDKNPVEREIKALYAQVKRMAELYEVEL